jgi:hypothetical protein
MPRNPRKYGLILVPQIALLRRMRISLVLMPLFAMVLSGCAGKKTNQAPPAPRAGTPAAFAKASVGGIVSRVEPVARFVVLSFPPDQVPAVDQGLNIYRQGAKIAQVKVSGPRRDNSIVADVISGVPEVGDEARAD